jgi:hypothetical protein
MTALPVPFCALALAVAAAAPPLLGATAPPAQETPREALDRFRDTLASQLWGVQVSAFGDVLHARDPETGRPKTGLGALELDLGADLGEALQASAALVATPEDLQLGVGFLDWHLFGGRIAPRGRLWVEKGFHVQAGRFDVPFGNDWQFFASKDSVSISRPLTTEAVMEGGYNDTGIRALGSDGTFNFNAYLLRGFSSGRLAGGRLGLAPFGNPFSLASAREAKVLELGVSFLFDRGSDARKRGSAHAFDSEFRSGPVLLRGEYLERTWEAVEDTPRRIQRGWHLDAEVALGEAVPWATTLFARYERAEGVSKDGGRYDIRWAAGASLSLGGLALIKIEGQRYLAATQETREEPAYRGTQILAQLVLVF